MTPPPSTAAARSSGVPEVSVLIPTLNEGLNVLAIAAAVVAELDKAGATFELVFIDNGSTDTTIEKLRHLCAADARTRVICNTRNFGQMRSPTYGIYQCRGRAVLAMCADFQDPPTLIGEMITRWRAGAKIVLGVRLSEKASFGHALARKLGYAFLSRFGDYPVIPEATGFGIYDRAVVDCLARWNEPEPFFRGMLVESGFALETIPYHRPARRNGKSKNNVFTGVSFALSGLASSSKALLRTPLLLSPLVIASGGLSWLAALVRAALGAGAEALFLAGLVQINTGLVLLFLGLFGEQLRLISERTRNMPLVIERERINFPEAEAS